MSWYNPASWFPGIVGKVMSANNYSANKKSFFAFNNKTIYFDLDSEANYKDAYNICSPLKSIINKRAQMFINGVIEIKNKNTDNVQRNDKTVKLLRDVLKRPNVLQTWKQFFAQFHIYIDLFGYCPVMKIEPAGMEGSGELSSLWCLPPWLFNIEFTGKWLKQTEISEIYKLMTLKWNGKDQPLEMKNICVVLDNGISTDSDGNLFLPDARVKGHEYEVSNINAAYKSRNTLITKKGAIGILSNIGKDASGPIRLEKKEKEAVQEDFRRYGLMGEDWQVIMTDASLQWQSMTFPTKDMMMFEEVEDCVLRLCDGLGLYSDLMGAIKKSTFANLNEAKKAQYQDYIIPDAEARLEQLSPFLLPGTNAYLFIDYSHIEILQESEKEKADSVVSWNTAMESLYKAGMITKAVWADKVGTLPPPDADKYVYESDNTPIGVKYGVGGTDSLIAILTGSMKAEQKKNTLIIWFGLTPEDALLLAGKDDPVVVDPNKPVPLPV